MQPIIGCEVYVAPRSRIEQGAARSDDYEAGGNYHLILLAMNREGYRNLCQLVTARLPGGLLLQAAHRQGAAARAERRPDRALRLPRAARSTRPSPPANSTRARASVASEYREHLRRPLLRRDPGQPPAAAGAVQPRADRRSRDELGLPLVATNDCHYLDARGRRAHEVLLCIQTGKTLHRPEKRWKFDTDQLYVKGPEEMRAAFADVPRGDRQHARHRASAATSS